MIDCIFLFAIIVSRLRVPTATALAFFWLDSAEL
jgi:hypothetical protein